MRDGWIVIPGWDKFQHYKDRRPVWIKLYTELRDRDEWRDLSLTARGLLTSIWIEYAARDALIDTRGLPTDLRQKVRRDTFDSLLEAGFVVLSASRPLAGRYHGASLEVEKRHKGLSTPDLPFDFNNLLRGVDDG